MSESITIIKYYNLNIFPVLLSKKNFFPFSSTNSISVPTLQLYIAMIAGSILATVLKSHIHILSALPKYSSVSISEKNLQPLSTSFTDSSLTHHLNFPLWLNIFFETILPPASGIKVTTLFILFHPFQQTCPIRHLLSNFQWCFSPCILVINQNTVLCKPDLI